MHACFGAYSGSVPDSGMTSTLPDFTVPGGKWLIPSGQMKLDLFLPLVCKPGMGRLEPEIHYLGVDPETADMVGYAHFHGGKSFT